MRPDSRQARVYESLGRDRSDHHSAREIVDRLERCVAVARATAGEESAARAENVDLADLGDGTLAAEVELARFAIAFASTAVTREWHRARLAACRAEQAARAQKGSRNGA